MFKHYFESKSKSYYLLRKETCSKYSFGEEETINDRDL